MQAIDYLDVDERRLILEQEEVVLDDNEEADLYEDSEPFLDDDEITDAEDGFMRGYARA